MLANIVLGLVLMSKVFGWDATWSVMHRRKKTKGESTEQGAEELAEQLAARRRTTED